MTNSKQEYNDFIRANLPGSIRYDSVRNRYVTANGKYFVTYKEAKWYVDYLVKRGSNLAYAEGGYTPSTILDYAGQKSYVGGNLTSSFDDVVTATRTGLATQLNSAGNLVWNAHNLLTYSEDFSNAAWAKSNTTVTANNATAPDGTNTADLIQHDISSTTPRIEQTVTVAAGSTNTFSVFVKASVNGFVRLLVLNTTNAYGGWFNTETGEWATTGVSGTGVLDSTDVVQFGDYYLISIKGSIPAATSYSAWVYLTDTDNNTTRSATPAIWAWGAHLYRSDLGGMAPVPLTRRVAGSTTYVPTTSAAVYLPREEAYTYVSGSLVGPYYQKESDARTNLITYSEDFTDASWTKVSTTVTADATTSPDGILGASKLISGSGVSGYLGRSVTFVSGQVYAQSVYAKAAEFDFLYLYLSDGTDVPRAWFNLSNGTVGTEISSPNAQIEDVGNGWYRCSIYQTAATSGTFANALRFHAVNADNETTVGDGTSGVFIYGAQLEAGSTPTSYIPTTSGSTVTRSADSTTISAGNMSYPTPQVIGPELVTNGTFDTDTDWTKGTGWTIGGGVAAKTPGVGSNIEQAISISAGAVYQISYSVSGLTAGSIQPKFLGGTNANGTLRTSNGSYTDIIVSNTGNNKLAVSANAGFDGAIDNISVREINPLALSFQMEGLVTYADNNAGNEVEFFEWEKDSNNKIYTWMNTGATRTGAAQFFQVNAGVGDTVISANDTYSPGINVPFNISSRHGSTFINGAVDGTALTADTTPTALPDLSATTFELAPTFNGFIKEFRVWGSDIGDTGISEAST